MGDAESGSEDGAYSKRQKMKSLLKEGLSRGKDELLKGRLVLEHSLGLGHQPNAIPAGEPDTRAPARTVRIGWHPVAGFAGRWLAEQTRLGAWIKETVHRYPDPSQHWAVLVGDFRHELWMDEHLDVIYVNGRADAEQWRTFAVGETRFNDEALRRTGELVMSRMRQQRPAYNLISNNCQHFALRLLEAIQVRTSTTSSSSSHTTTITTATTTTITEFATSLAVVRAMTGPGKVRDLFAEKPGGEQVVVVETVEAVAVTEEEEEEEDEGGEGKGEDRDQLGIVALARRLMDEHTTKLDFHLGVR